MRFNFLSLGFATSMLMVSSAFCFEKGLISATTIDNDAENIDGSKLINNADFFEDSGIAGYTVGLGDFSGIQGRRHAKYPILISSVDKRQVSRRSFLTRRKQGHAIHQRRQEADEKEDDEEEDDKEEDDKEELNEEELNRCSKQDNEEDEEENDEEVELARRSQVLHRRNVYAVLS